MSHVLTLDGKLLHAGGAFLTTGAAAVPNGSAATSLTLNDVTNERIYQRTGTSKQIAVSGTYAGTASLIQARLVNADTGAQVTPWGTLDAAPAGGNYAGLLDVPQGGFYKLQVRDGVNNAVTANGNNRFAVGALIALLGQSNMRNLSQQEGSYPLADLKARRWSGTAWGFVGNHDATGTYPAGTTFATYGNTRTDVTPRGDGIVTFVNALRASLGIPVGVMEFAVSGSNISQWQQGGACWEPFEAAALAIGGDFETTLWYQGEDNAANNTSSSSYQASLLNVMNNCRVLAGRNASTQPFGVVTLGPTTNYGAEGSFGTIRAAQLAFVAGNAGTFLAGVATDGTEQDSVHLVVESLVRMGKRYAKAITAYLAGTPKPGPSIASATRSGNVVTVSITGATGALKDGTGGNGAGLKGFRGFDGAASPVAVTATSISGNTVVLTTDGPIATLDYAMANTPYSRPPLPAEILYDSDTVPGDTLGLPLAPCAAITVTGS